MSVRSASTQWSEDDCGGEGGGGGEEGVLLPGEELD